MPWKVIGPVEQKMEFVVRWKAGERVKDLCREFGISEKTGHKLLGRYAERGIEGLNEQSRRPLSSPNRTPPDVVARLLKLREDYPTWGPKKLRERFLVLNPGVRVPAVSTIGVMLQTAGVTRQRPKRRRATPSTSLKQTHAPNELWCIDFKGHFRLGNKQLCYPLTLSDHFSRFVLTCEALENTRSAGVKAALADTFREWGLPDAIRSDNGTPFASTGFGGLSSLSVWLLRLGIALERIAPGHPEQNGRHERMHLTYKQDATRPPGANILQQQERSDRFRQVFNYERPHEALGMKTPSEIYNASSKPFDPKPLEPLEYPLHDATTRVSHSGHAVFGRRHFYIGTAFAGENIGVRELTAGTWLVSFMNMDIGYADTQGTFSRLKFDALAESATVEESNTGLPMSPV